MNEMEIFQKRLNDRMKELTLSPQILARKTGMSEKAIRGYQKGSNYPRPYSLMVLAKALRVSVNYLTGAEDEVGT